MTFSADLHWVIPQYLIYKGFSYSDQSTDLHANLSFTNEKKGGGDFIYYFPSKQKFDR